MKSNVLLIAASGLLLLVNCTSSSRGHWLKGVVRDTTTNMISVVEKEDTLSFNTTNAEKEDLDGLFIGDSVEVYYKGAYTSGMEALKVTSLTHPESVMRTLFFEEGVRTETVDGSFRSLYIRFSPDSLKTELYYSDKKEKQTWRQHTHPSGKHFWSLNEENDAISLHRTDRRWMVTEKDKILYAQPKRDADESLGMWTELHYERTLPAADCLGIHYQLTLRQRQHSGDGSFLLRLTFLEAENGRDVSFVYTGKRMTQRGTTEDPDATVLQLTADQGGLVYNFLQENDEHSLTLLNQDFKRNQSALNYSLKKAK